MFTYVNTYTKKKCQYISATLYYEYLYEYGVRVGFAQNFDVLLQNCIHMCDRVHLYS